MIDNLKTTGERKIHLKMKINFMSMTDPIEYHHMHSKSDNSGITSGFDTDEIIEELF